MKIKLPMMVLTTGIYLTGCTRSQHEVPRTATPNKPEVSRSATPKPDNERHTPDYPRADVTEGQWQVPGLADSTMGESVSQSELETRALPEELRKTMRQPPEPDPIYVTPYKLNTLGGAEYVIPTSFFTKDQWQTIRQATNTPSRELAVLGIRKFNNSDGFSYVVVVYPKGERRSASLRGLHFYGGKTVGKIEGVEGVPFDFSPRKPGARSNRY